MIIVRKVKSLFRLIKRNYNWYRDAQYCRGKLTAKELQAIPEGKKLVLMPHSDDEWIGCSQLLLKEPQNMTVFNMDMPGGDTEELHRLRREEAEAASKKYGYTLLTADKQEAALTNFLQIEKPKCVFLPCYLDWHEEHITVMKQFQLAAEQTGYTGLVGMYQVSLPISESMINSGIPMNRAQLRQKWATLKTMYKTQAFLPTRRFMLNEYINGGIVGTNALEAYSICAFDRWNAQWEDALLTVEEKKMCMNHLQEIRYIRSLLKLRDTAEKKNIE